MPKVTPKALVALACVSVPPIILGVVMVITSGWLTLAIGLFIVALYLMFVKGVVMIGNGVLRK